MDGTLFRDVSLDVITNILILLPVQSLLRFKCVCKLWCALMKTPDFVALHLNCSRCRSNKDRVLVYGHVLDNYPFCSIISMADSSVTDVDVDLGLLNNNLFSSEILCHCHGVICAVDERGYSILCNYSARDTIMLPETCLDPDVKYVSLGFGYDLKTNQYKVVRIASYYFFGGGYFSRLEVYTIGADSWREIKNAKINAKNAWRIGYFSSGIYFNGAIHWFGCDDDHQKAIILFNLGDEDLGMMPMPRSLEIASLPCNDMQVLVWNERSIAVAKLSFREIETSIEIFVMKEYGVEESWIKLFSVGLGLLGTFICRAFIFRTNDEILMEWSDENRNQHLVSYNLVTQQVNKFAVSVVSVRGALCEAFVYEESLVSVRGR